MHLGVSATSSMGYEKKMIKKLYIITSNLQKFNAQNQALEKICCANYLAQVLQRVEPHCIHY